MKNTFSKRTLHQQLALAGLLGMGAFIYQSTANAANYGSLNGSTITLNNGDVVTADTKYNSILTGIYNTSGTTASINLGSGSKVIADGNGTSSRGIYLQGSNTTLNASNLTIDVKGAYASGLYVSGSNSQINLGTGSQISVERDPVVGMTGAKGISLSGASTLTADALTIKTIGDGGVGLSVDQQGTTAHLGSGSFISTNGSSSSALTIFGANGSAANGKAKFDATNLTLLTEGINSYGIDLQKNSFVDLGSGSTIITHGTNSTGVWVHGEFKADAISITTTGDGNAVALEVREGGIANVGANSHVRANQNGAIVASDAGALVNFKGTETERNSIYSGGSYGASAQFAGSVVNLANTDITIDRNGSLGLGLWAMGGGKITGENLNIEVAQGARGVYAMTDSHITLSGNTVIHLADNTGMAIATQHNVGYEPSTITGTGKMTIDGGIYARGNGVIDLSMAPGSRLTGGTSVDLANGGKVNMSLSDSIWNMSQDSAVSKLALNNSTVDFTEDKTGSILSVGDLSGNGTFVMRINMVDDSADKLVVTGSSAGNHNVRVLNRGSLATTGNEVITIVETEDGLASFNLQNNTVSRAAVELGGYKYDLRKNLTNWELYASGTGGGGEGGGDGGGSPEITTTASASANFLNISYMLNYAETQTLLQRMGELRQTENSQGDVWARAFTGKFDSFSGGKLSGFDMDYTGVQAGVDRRLNMTGADVYLGVMGGATKADSNYQEGDGNIDGYHFGIYGTYVTPNDFYIDGTLKYSHIKNKFNVKDSQYNQINGSASSDGYGLSIEVGKRFYFADVKTGYYIEPQAQLSYLHQDSSSTNADNGLVVDLDSYDSTLGRVSAIVGYEVKEGKNPVNVYFKTGYVAEMSGDVGYRLNGNPETHDFGGGWWENGIGVTTQLNKKHNLYLDGTYATGSKFDQMQINAGYRFSF